MNTEVNEGLDLVQQETPKLPQPFVELNLVELGCIGGGMANVSFV